MPFGEIPTMLSLDRFAFTIGYSPLHIAQVVMGDSSPCGFAVNQYAWQANGRFGREDLLRVIDEAERAIMKALRFAPLPRYFEADPVDFKRTRYGRNWDPGSFGGTEALRAQTRWGYLIEAGASLKTAMTLVQQDTDPGAPVVLADIFYQDLDDDDYPETATATFTLPAGLTDPEEVHLYYPGESGAPEWEIRPITVTLGGGLATVTFRREQAVIPERVYVLDPEEVSGTDDTGFLTTVDAYWIRTDPQTAGVIQVVNDCGCGGDEECVACGFDTQVACAQIMDPEWGMVALRPATWDASGSRFEPTDWTSGYSPRRATLSYRAGWRYQDSTVRMDPMWERAISYYALALLGGPLCGCEWISRQVDYYQTDLAEESGSGDGSSQSFRYSRQFLENPFGSTRGAVYAWTIVQREMLGEAINIH